MNDTPTPRTDNFKSQGREWLPLGIFEKVERELTAVTEQRNELENKLEKSKSYKNVMKRDNAELRKQLTAAREEIKELNDKLDDAVADATNAVNDIIRMKWQRDRLIEALERIADYQGRFAEEDPTSIATEALQSLTTNDSVEARRK